MTLCAKKSFEINATDLEGFSEDGGHTRAVVLCVGSLWSCCSSLCWEDGGEPSLVVLAQSQ